MVVGHELGKSFEELEQMGLDELRWWIAFYIEKNRREAEAVKRRSRRPKAVQQ